MTLTDERCHHLRDESVLGDRTPPDERFRRLERFRRKHRTEHPT